ncbi:NAD(P)H-hydrate dehydratase [Caenimonas aquaedulcis]|uniref:Bifunctional NAD(P)H-hydrate repair enzyme n=1 Tax=Caenimonas aquaedulcis TaxID=2793270 RepID=A0A931H1A5_9BURK|nr:NAD(P)H-hydrate dehydratase [Caenimonas aquaedulcis]MBG9386708.1 NAD(P)H-hydrate dehydratase [Caenimonas aquaedulcis]
MLRVTPQRRWPLFDTAAVRTLETSAAAGLAPHMLMQRAGLAVARLALAMAPHARSVWIACGPGNNGGDGMEAAVHLKQWGKQPVVTWAGDESRAPPDALASMRSARAAGVEFAAAPPATYDLAIDAMLGIGSSRPLDGVMLEWLEAMNTAGAPVLAVDVPSGLDADTGHGQAVRASHTLCLLGLKPGLFTAGGRDASAEVWVHDLGASIDEAQATAWLAGPPGAPLRAHASHKGSYGDVAVIGGAPGMAGAALLAASAALHAGAGRVYAALLDPAAITVDPSQPELMLRAWETLDISTMHVACGCGGGDAVRAVLPKVLAASGSLVLDADALNAISSDTHLQNLLRSRGRRGKPTVLTPHPLEAARLLGCKTADIQSDRLRRARELCESYESVVVLKGSGTVVAAPGTLPSVNPTGNGRLATAGTGDVLAGMIAARLALGDAPADAARGAVFRHGLAADDWPASEALTASALARRQAGG